MPGVTPLVLATGAGAASRISLGVTVLYGMAAAMLLVTLMTPAFYVMIQGWRERFARPAQKRDIPAPEESMP